MTVTIGIGAVTIEQVVAVARHGERVELSDEALAAIAASRALIDELAGDPEPHYGVSTGFGALATAHIPPERRQQLQRSLVRSHAASSGQEVEREVVRGTMLLRLSTLATGRTGIRPVVAEQYVALLNAGITPVIGEYGSLGCSGDLAPLAHCALAAMGEGEVRDAAGTLMDGGDALAAAGLEPIVLQEKEGLALINGTDGMLAMLALAITDLRELLDHRRPRRRDERGGARRAPTACSRPTCRRCARIRVRRGRPPPCAPCSPARRRSPPTPRRGSPGCRMPTRCAAPRRCTGRPATPSTTPPSSPDASWLARSTTPSSRSTDGSSRTATSTARRSGTCSTSSPSPRPTSRA